MLERAIFILTFAAAIGSGVVGGIFYAFSSFVMAALGSLPSAQGAGAMKAINVTVINPVFMLAFMGTAVLCLVLAGSLIDLVGPARRDADACRQPVLSARLLRRHHAGSTCP